MRRRLLLSSVRCVDLDMLRRLLLLLLLLLLRLLSLVPLCKERLLATRGRWHGRVVNGGRIARLAFGQDNARRRTIRWLCRGVHKLKTSASTCVSRPVIHQR